MKQRHPNIINLKDLDPRIEAKNDKFGFEAKRLGVHVGAKKIGASYFEIPPGRQAFPQHFHTANEEAAFVIEGQGQVRIGQEKVEISAGDYISFPVGPDHAHSILNNSSAVLKLLCISTLKPVEAVGYPDSKKTGVFAMSDSSKGLLNGPAPWIRMLVKDQPSVDYYDGELE